MSTEELKEYLGIVVDMEESVYLQKNLLSNINGEIEQLRTPKQFNTPGKPIEPMHPANPEHHNFLFFLFFALALPFMEPLLGIGLLISTGIAADFLGISFLAVVPIVYILGVVYYQISDQKKEEKRIETEYQTHMQEYYSQVKKYQEDVAKIQREREQDEVERKVKVIFLQNQKVEIEKMLVIAKERLQKIYEKNIIFPKYRNLTMACSLYEYICAGRCTELEGHEGAYNILETEIRLDHIILQLDKVIAQLEQIKHNQFMLYSAVQESNHRASLIQRDLDRMAGSLDGLYTTTTQLNTNAAQLNARITELQETSALTAYHTERTQKELAYMNRMDYLAGRNDDVFFNHPPV